jgi:hypothetical protein
MSLARFLSAAVVAVVLAAGASAEEKVVDALKVAGVEGTKLKVTKSNGDSHSAEVASDAKITVDGKDVKLSALATGTKVKVTLRKDGDKLTVVKVEGRTK